MVHFVMMAIFLRVKKVTFCLDVIHASVNGTNAAGRRILRMIPKKMWKTALHGSLISTLPLFGRV